MLVTSPVVQTGNAHCQLPCALACASRLMTCRTAHMRASGAMEQQKDTAAGATLLTCSALPVGADPKRRSPGTPELDAEPGQPRKRRKGSASGTPAGPAPGSSDVPLWQACFMGMRRQDRCALCMLSNEYQDVAAEQTPASQPAVMQACTRASHLLPDLLPVLQARCDHRAHASRPW